MNGQVEAVNMTIVAELKCCLGNTKGAWVDELLDVLWGYRCSPRWYDRRNPIQPHIRYKHHAPY